LISPSKNDLFGRCFRGEPRDRRVARPLFPSKQILFGGLLLTIAHSIAASLAFILTLSAPEPPARDAAHDAVARAAAAARAAEAASGAVVGVSAFHLESGSAASHRGGETFQMASVFKLPVAIAVLDAVEKGRLRLEDAVEIRQEDRRKFGPLDDEWKPGLKVTIARMLDVMIVSSDNTAVDKLCALLGGPHAAEVTLAAKGVKGVRISLDEKGMDAAAKRDRRAFERGAANGASPDAIAALLARFHRGELLSRASTERLRDALRRCATSDHRLRAGLPNGTEVLDKTGTTNSCANDVGIVTLPGGTHLVLAVLVRGGKDAAAREAAIASVARAAYEPFAPGP
jgi:beta-lactamase class A